MYKYLVPAVLALSASLGLPAVLGLGASAPNAAPIEIAQVDAVEEPEAAPLLEGHAPAVDLACGLCHVSDDPAEGSAELRACPRPRAVGGDHSSEEAPDVILIDKLADIYVPVVFPHKLHAAMTEMGGGCETCHHNNPPGPILACDECHGGPSNPANLRQPSLKGAYHRQCLNCHREWTHETDCAVCHAKAAPGVVPRLPEDPTDIMGMLHPNVEVPDKAVYNIPDLEDTPVVTFHHKMHAETFGLKCAECHRQESCSRCHDPEAHHARKREDPHQDCAQCHQPELDSDCTYCHKERETPAVFDHALLTGHALEAWHGSVGCRQCHPGERRFTPAAAACEVCHPVDWSPADGEFDHALTSQPLDELHQAAGCQDCHSEGMGKPASCDTCHDDGRTRFEPAEESKE